MTRKVSFYNKDVARHIFTQENRYLRNKIHNVPQTVQIYVDVMKLYKRSPWTKSEHAVNGVKSLEPYEVEHVNKCNTTAVA